MSCEFSGSYCARLVCSAVFFVSLGPLSAFGQQAQPLEFKSDTLKQGDIASGQTSLLEIRRRGMEVFATPFTKKVGYGDGPVNTADPTSPGGRPTLQNNSKFLRVNGLDAQTCMECHSILSNLTVPFTFGLGGVGGSNANAMAKPTAIDVADTQHNGFAAFNGRFINPPFLFGSGGVELLAKEMTEDLQTLKARAMRQPGVAVPLVTKGVNFGTIQFVGGSLDTSGVRGVDPDLVIRPFGRKGQFANVRAFDVSAMQFHFGMQPVEAVGFGVDADGDGVVNEISEGDLSALSIFLTTMDLPRRTTESTAATNGEGRFHSLGCAACHMPALETRGAILTYSLPEVETDSTQNVYYSTDLRAARPGFQANGVGGIEVPLFSDLKRHDMGPGLAESTGSDLDRYFITARLWGVADTAPYLHDGRAHTLQEAILLHGGEAQGVRDAFAALPDSAQQELVAFLMTLRTPVAPAGDLMPLRPDDRRLGQIR
ncbi:MAG TPA: di-heme oxidoredictase family protein [Bryobacteraceae bacterium]|nr:di-heme oxidoredictase family protein [Bryobacteraceae bacterium]